MTDYTISLKYTPEVTSEDNGNFEVLKEYKVTNNVVPEQPIKGLVVQCVKKNSYVTDSTGVKHDTTEAIETFTSGSVKYSNDSYFEIFYLDEEGESNSADSFANNSLVKYEKIRRNLVPYTYEVGDAEYNTFKTMGEINVIGTNCFISQSNPNYKAIRRLPWKKTKKTPANGLPFLSYSPQNYNFIFGSSDSNTLVHKVNVIWSFEEPKSSVTSEVIENQPYAPLPLTGGNGRNTKKYRKSRNKKRTRKLSSN